MSDPLLNPQFRRRWHEPPSAAHFGGRLIGLGVVKKPGRPRTRRMMPPIEVRRRSFDPVLKGNLRGFTVVVVELGRAIPMHWP